MEFQEVHAGKLLKATDVAEILNISRSMSYRMIQTGQIRSVNIGSARRVRPIDLVDFITRNLTPSTNQELT
jgi:excisionase family DNA binding protein